VSEAGPGFGPHGRSLACLRGGHHECGHINIAVRARKSRDRLESTIALCRCSCHASCSLADRMPVRLTIWQQLCTCPGGDKQRRWKEDPDEPFPGFREARERDQRKSQERRDARRQAFDAARDAAAAGMTRAEIRDVYIAELRNRDQDIPPEPFLEADLDLLTGHPVQGLRKIWKKLRDPFADL
jgi:hypothetical protein